MITVNNLTIRYKQKTLFENQNFQIKNNCLTAIIGESGCGKTSLLYFLGLLSQITDGDYWIDDIRINDLSNSQKDKLRRSNIGFMFQEYMLYDHLNIYENMKLYATINNQNLDENKAKLLLKTVYLDLDLKRKLYTLSGGQKQRIALACILAKNPHILILDEPTSALDKENRNIIFKILNNLKKDKTVIIASHNKEVLDYSDEIIEIKNSEIVKIKENSTDTKTNLQFTKNKLPLGFYLDYIKKFTSHSKKTNLLIMALILTVLIINLFVSSYGEIYIEKNKEILMQDCNGQIFITGDKIENDNYQYPYYHITFKIGENSYPVVPYYENDNLDNKIWTRFNYATNQGFFLSYQLYLEQKEVITPVATMELRLETSKHEITAPFSYIGLLKNGVTSGYLENNDKFIYMHHQLIEDLISDETIDGYTLFGDSYENTIALSNEAEKNGFQVSNDFGSFKQIQATIKFVTYLKNTISLIMIVVAVFLISILYTSYFERRKKELALLKALGLTTTEVAKIILLELLKIMIICLIITIILLTINCIFISINFLANLLILIISAIVIFSITSLIIKQKINKIIPANVFRN